MNQKFVLNKKTLIIIATIVLVIVIALIIALGKTSSMDKGNTNFIKQNEFKSNSKKLTDYDENVMQYGEDTYLLDKASKAIYRINDRTIDKILQFNAEPSEKFFIRSNKLIFSYGDVTYYSDLDGKNVAKLTNGEVNYIDDNVYMFISHQKSNDELYIISYDSKNFRATNEISSNIAYGSSIKYLKADGKNVYYTSVNSNNKLSILEVDIENRTAKLITKISKDSGYANMYFEVSDILKTKDGYYFVVNEMTSTTNEDNIFNYSYLYRRNIEENSEEIIDENVGPFLNYYSKVKDEIIYEKFDEDGNGIWQTSNELKQTNYEWEEFKYGNVTSHFDIEGTNLIKDGETFADFERDMEEYILEKVVRLDNGYYISVNDGIETTMWYHCDEDGNNMEELF